LRGKKEFKWGGNLKVGEGGNKAIAEKDNGPQRGRNGQKKKTREAKRGG